MGKLVKVTEQIKSALQRDTRGLTIKELSSITDSSRITTAMALMRLEGEGLVVVRVVGNCKLHYWRRF